eukprot:g14791.t1
MIRVVNLFPEPLRTEELVEKFFADQKQECGWKDEFFKDDCHTKYAEALFGAAKGSLYRMGKEEVLAELERFLNAEGVGVAR